jgi:hypothetical protein
MMLYVCSAHTHTLQFLIHDIILTFHFEAIAVILTSLLILSDPKLPLSFIQIFSMYFVIGLLKINEL